MADEPIVDTEITEPEEKTFTQAELDAIVGKRVAKATKGMPSAEELAAFKAWKANQQTEAEKLTSMTKERDDALSALTEANAKIEAHEREKILTGLGVPSEDMDYYLFKIGKLVTEKVSFEKAAESFFAERAAATRARIDTSGNLSGGKPATVTTNDTMNKLFRNLRH